MAPRFAGGPPPTIFVPRFPPPGATLPARVERPDGPRFPPPGVIAVSRTRASIEDDSPAAALVYFRYGGDFAELDRQPRPGRASPGLLATYPQALVDNFVHRFIPMLWITFSTGFPQGVDNARTLVR